MVVVAASIAFAADGSRRSDQLRAWWMSVAVEQERKLAQLRDRVEELEEQVGRTDGK